MSIVQTETSPRALLESALKLKWTFNLMDADGEGDSALSVASLGPGFILAEVERTLKQIRKDLDVHNTEEKQPKPPLMMRLREDIDAISSVLTGNSVNFKQPDSTTLHELIESLNILNQSVCTKETRSFCIIS